MVNLKLKTIRRRKKRRKGGETGLNRRKIL
jgi:hypothetical protein